MIFNENGKVINEGFFDKFKNKNKRDNQSEKQTDSGLNNYYNLNNETDIKVYQKYCEEIRQKYSAQERASNEYIKFSDDIKFMEKNDLVVIRDDGMGNLFMMSNNDKIYFWDHEYGWGSRSGFKGKHYLSFNKYLEYIEILNDESDDAQQKYDDFVSKNNIKDW